MTRKEGTGGQDGFTLVELLLALVISVLVIAGVTALYAQLFRQYKQESRVTETDIGSAIGLNYLVDDIRAAGYGLPWTIPTNVPVRYDDYKGNSPIAAQANDNFPHSNPRAIVPMTPNGYAFGDYLVIKSQSAAISNAAGKSIPLTSNGALNGNAPWTTNIPPAQCAGDPENLCPTDRVIVLSSLDNSPTLVDAGPEGWSPTYNDAANNPTYVPSIANATNMIYGVATNTDAPNGLLMPYNRTDYFIAAGTQNGWDGHTVTVPSRCAPGTGELIKAVVSQSDGTFKYYPILDCAATMKVNFLRASGALVDAGTIQQTDTTADLIRQDVRQARVFILAQEGQIDPSYTVPAAKNPIWLGDCPSPPVSSGICTSYPLTGSQVHYRWRVYTIVEKPFNLGAQ